MYSGPLMRPSLDGVTRRCASGISDELSGVADDAGLARDVEAGVEAAGVDDDFGSSEEPPHELATATRTASATRYRIL
jgi:hypothetical protein